ncbi:sigma-70 family RNA polymerase sigma factor [Candidatus Peregrinibacteria bacterium]|jgi:RNA polymerase sigma-70 factor, ECF subfamily|nr:sigma-70 family RNA polymerase sigma factor [Candidatus Peregrinibacteria bacterium]MBT7484631.1 sigma-70 family RNA polymerase sigma factor [Candidatus Peregrinibacteria bacterium]
MHDDSQTADTELVALALQNPDYFTPLVERYEPKLFRYIRRFAGLSKECAEDVLQEAFLKIYRNLNDFDGDLKFSSWVYRIAHNETVSYLRKNKKKETVTIENNDPDMINLLDVLESDANVVNDAKKMEIREKVRQVLGELPQKYREVLVLRFLEELDYAEISDVLRKPMGTVATLLNRAKTKFKELAIKNHLTLLLHE